MTPLLAFTLAAMSELAPGRDHDELGAAIAHVVETQAPLFQDDQSRFRTTALMVAVGFREGSLRADIVGDMVHGRPTSWCAYQINLSPGARTTEGWTGPELRDDPEKCATVALRMLRESVRVDPKHPVAFYARGPGWRSEPAQRISRDRMAIARKLIASVAGHP